MIPLNREMTPAEDRRLIADQRGGLAGRAQRRWLRLREHVIAMRRVLWALSSILLALGFVWLWRWGVPALYGEPDVTKLAPADQVKAVTDTRTALLAGVAAIGALGTFWLTGRAQRFTAETLRLSQESQLTDRYAKALEHLGDEKKYVRVGCMYALEHLAADSIRDYSTVVEVLSTYVRDRVPKDSTADVYRVPPVDAQAALTVLGRLRRRLEKVEALRREDFGLLAQAVLTKIDLHGTNLAGADLREADLRGANLRGADLANADLVQAKLDSADLTGAVLADADVTDASLLAVVTQGQVDSAQGNTRTKLPEGIFTPPHWIKPPDPLRRAAR